MKQTKRCSLIIATLIFLTVCFVFGVNAETDTFTEGYYTYTVTDGYATITDVDTSISGDVVVPSILGGYPVKAIIGDPLTFGPFSYCMNITSISIPYGVETIRNAFYACGEFQSISLPESLLEIDDSFAQCVNLKEITIPGSIKIADGFRWCSSLESITFSKGIEEIAAEAFMGAYNLKRITFPESLKKIGNDAFNGCILLRDITIPQNVTHIGKGAFRECLSLENVNILSDIVDFDEKSIAFTSGELKDKTNYEFAKLALDKDLAWLEMYKAYVANDVEAYEKYLKICEKLEAEYNNCFILYDESIVMDNVTIYAESGSTAEIYANQNGIKFEVITENTTITDSNTNVEIEYDNSAFETEVELIVSEEEINANIVFGNEFESYKAYDISLVADGERVQPNGYVTVKLPIPEGFNADSTVVYYVAPDGTKTKLDSKAENRYVVFETNHFSEYVLVDESSKIEPPHQHSYTPAVTKNPTCTEAGVKTFTCSCNDSYTESIPALGHKDTNGDYKCDNGCGYEYEKPAPEEPEDPSKDCSCNCHKGGFMGFIWKIINFFQKLFKTKQYCACGAKHW